MASYYCISISFLSVGNIYCGVLSAFHETSWNMSEFHDSLAADPNQFTILEVHWKSPEGNFAGQTSTINQQNVVWKLLI